MQLPPEAIEAIQKGIENNDHICDLELLGLDQRRINLLTEEANINTLAELMSKTREQLMAIPNFGGESLKLVFRCLAKYDQLDDLRTIKPLEQRRKPRVSYEGK